MSNCLPAHAANGDWKELARRAGGGLQISLLWSKSGDRVKVTVHDERLGRPFDIHVDGAHALSIFHHPFAYAASPSALADDTERNPLNLRQQV
jgi:hypothetical protein